MENKDLFRIWHENRKEYLKEPCVLISGGNNEITIFERVDGILQNQSQVHCKKENCLGLRDRNKNLIFDGDIVIEYFGKTGTYSVHYNDNSAYFFFSNIDDESPDFEILPPCLCEGADEYQGWPEHDLEIIGNINQNPELLEVK